MDIQRMRELAGITFNDGMSAIKNTVAPMHKLTESWDDDDYDDDDDLSAAERELAASASKDLKKKGVDVEADVAAARKKEKAAAAAKAKAEKDAEQSKDKPAPKAEEKPAAKPAEKEPAKKDDTPDEKDDDKKSTGSSVFGQMAKDLDTATKNAPAAKRGRGRAETDRTGQFRNWVVNNPNATRKDAMEYGAGLGMNSKHINTKFYQFRKSVKEFWVIVNPENARVLAEHSTTARPVWVSYEDVNTFDSWIFISESEAVEYANKLLDAGSSKVVLMNFNGDDYEDEDEE